MGMHMVDTARDTPRPDSLRSATNGAIPGLWSSGPYGTLVGPQFIRRLAGGCIRGSPPVDDSPS